MISGISDSCLRALDIEICCRLLQSLSKSRCLNPTLLLRIVLLKTQQFLLTRIKDQYILQFIGRLNLSLLEQEIHLLFFQMLASSLLLDLLGIGGCCRQVSRSELRGLIESLVGKVDKVITILWLFQDTILAGRGMQLPTHRDSHSLKQAILNQMLHKRIQSCLVMGLFARFQVVDLHSGDSLLVLNYQGVCQGRQSNRKLFVINLNALSRFNRFIIIHHTNVR
ncbi:hypothetical protein FGO68_gene13866 [Halteria grandinella]|uniref:Uncharacterized protein n=1 Tax=Halteria grandinella TaxID=5974 RepID=A0A8J8NZG7_HALGN|nr:hypothetical protein FGO68_gene13866 [Halteria grandinella]